MNSRKSVHGAIAVTGATGWVGGAVCEALTRQGVQVVRLGRRAGAGVDLVWDCAADLTDEVVRSLSTVAAVIHCAAHVHRPNENKAERDRFFDTNVGGTRRLIQACVRAGIPRLVLVSSIALYRWDSPGPRCEEDSVETSTAYAESKHQAEELVRGAPLDWRIARLATVYGRGDRANFARLAKALARRRFVVPGSGAARKSVIRIDRAGELLARLALHDQAGGLTVNLANPDAPSLREICDAFCRLCGFPAALRLPQGVMSLIGRIGDWVSRGVPAFPYTSRTLRKLMTSTTVSTARQGILFPELAWSGFMTELREHAGYYEALRRE